MSNYNIGNNNTRDRDGKRRINFINPFTRNCLRVGILRYHSKDIFFISDIIDVAYVYRKNLRQCRWNEQKPRFSQPIKEGKKEFTTCPDKIAFPGESRSSGRARREKMVHKDGGEAEKLLLCSASEEGGQVRSRPEPRELFRITRIE